MSRFLISDRGHKRKRTRIGMALDGLEDGQEELGGIAESEEESHAISSHVLAPENILNSSAKKRRVTFSTVTREDLKKAGVMRKRLVFDAPKVNALIMTRGLTPHAAIETVLLHARLKNIYAHVNMDYPPGSRMILDAILLTSAQICSAQQRKVAILPGLRIAQEEGVRIAHPVSGYEVWLSGNVDYAVIEYEDVEDNKDRLLAPGGSREDALAISTGRMLLVEARGQSPEQSFATYIPKAVSQAIAVLKCANLAEVRFCLSDGQSWMFFILKSHDGTLTYYESAIRRLSRDVLACSDVPLREIVQLVCEWLRPTMNDLFELE
ncbi:hypothetical protein BJ912DRAFT_958115 [Pholiota molesta]|nr:hypothetical protein BJ912DRAFT_958115 [Pholiota molesta]